MLAASPDNTETFRPPPGNWPTFSPRASWAPAPPAPADDDRATWIPCATEAQS
jgi:hypothetical protein